VIFDPSLLERLIGANNTTHHWDKNPPTIAVYLYPDNGQAISCAITGLQVEEDF